MAREASKIPALHPMTRVIYRDKVEMKTFTATPATIKREWFVVDATDKTLGRLATELAHRLRGKHKPTYTPNMDTGDHLIVVNAEKIKVTGKKLEDKIYYRHTGYIGNLKSINLGKMLETHPERVIQKAVKGMLPRNPLGRANFRKLHVYAGPDHPHTAQQPAQLEL
jgi:large subunit ribosomal protein L13